MKENDLLHRFKTDRFCAVYGCFNRPQKNRTFFSFPFQKDLKDAWIQFTRREGFVPSKFSRICSEHFQKKEIKCRRYQSIKGTTLRLKKGAIPTIFNDCNERPFPKYKCCNQSSSHINRENSFSTSNQYATILPPQDHSGNTEFAPVKQEVLSEGESAQDHSTHVTAFPLTELITKLRSKLPKSVYRNEPEMPLPIITNIRPVVKLDPDSPKNQFTSNDDAASEEYNSFVASSLVHCQLEIDYDDEYDPFQTTVPSLGTGSTLRDLLTSRTTSSSAAATGNAVDLCGEKGGLYTQEVNSNVRQSDPDQNGDSSSDAVDSPIVAEMNDRLTDTTVSASETVVPVAGVHVRKATKASENTENPIVPNLPPLDKFQLYGQILGERLRRLPSKTCTLLQKTIDELMLNAEDGQYDLYDKTEHVLQKRYIANRALKQIGGFSGYDV